MMYVIGALAAVGIVAILGAIYLIGYYVYTVRVMLRGERYL